MHREEYVLDGVLPVWANAEMAVNKATASAVLRTMIMASFPNGEPFFRHGEFLLALEASHPRPARFDVDQGGQVFRERGFLTFQRVECPH